MGRAVIGVPVGAELPKGFLDQLAQATNLELSQHVILAADGQDDAAEMEAGNSHRQEDVRLLLSADADILMGVDQTWLQWGLAPHSEGADLEGDELSSARSVTYGLDNACLLADASWFSANDLPLPQTLSEMPGQQLERVVADSNPVISPFAMALLPQWSSDWDAWAAVEAAQSGDTPSEEPASTVAGPGIVGSELEPLRNPNNIGTDTRYRVLADSCVTRKVEIVDLAGTQSAADAATGRQDAAFVILSDFLTGTEGQALLDRYAVATPITQSANLQSGEDAPAGAVRPSYSVKQVREALQSWQDTFG